MSETEIEPENVFSYLSDDVVLNIFFKLEDDPRNWSTLACVCTKFSSLIRTICCKTKCYQSISTVVSDLLPPNSSVTSTFSPPGGWSSLHKLAVCCPGLVHSGVLLENSDFGLERHLGPDENFPIPNLIQSSKSQSKPSSSSSTSQINDKTREIKASKPSSSTSLNDDKTREIKPSINRSDCSWSLYDDLYLDTVYDNNNDNDNSKIESRSDSQTELIHEEEEATKTEPISKRRKTWRCLKAHLAAESWNFSREQGNKLLASRFRGDCLYICDWPGCVHTEEKRNYMLFRGVFKNFKKSRVWRTINDGNRSKIDLNCAFCNGNEVWELHSAFCLRPAYGFHDDGEPVVRAYVCENGHVSGAWTDWPLYT